jgi:hypothetical protein
MSRLDIEKQKKEEAKRIDIAKAKLISIGFEIMFESKSELRIWFRGKTVKLFPYSGWHTGPTIVDGRGLNKLIKQLVDGSK